jgi:GNAT superfamily N-acetyltransferase
MPVRIEIAELPSDVDREAILKPLLAYNEANGGAPQYAPIAIKLCDAATGVCLGGLWGQLYYDWLFVELLYIPEAERRQDIGSTLMAEAETIARRKGCVGVWLDTFSFQAPEFYRKLDYEVFGTLNDYPRGGARLFLRKLLPNSPRRREGDGGEAPLIAAPPDI